MLDYLWVGLGGALGSVARFWAAGFVARQFGEALPYGTLVVNVTGSLFIGFFAAATGPDGRWLAASGTRAFFMAGVCGGYTTFSSFSEQTLSLARAGQWLQAGANIILSVVCCLIAGWVGHSIAMSLALKSQ